MVSAKHKVVYFYISTAHVMTFDFFFNTILALNKLIEKLDNRLVKKQGAHYMGFTKLPRIVGVSSQSNAPENAPKWAVTTSNALKLFEFMFYSPLTSTLCDKLEDLTVTAWHSFWYTMC